MAFMQMLQKQDSGSVNDLMPMILMSKMMNPAPKTDPTMTMMMLEMMKNRTSGSSDLEKKIERLEAQIAKQEDDKKYNLIMSRIDEITKAKDTLGTKELIQLLSNKDATISQKEREVLASKFDQTITTLQSELRNMKSGGGDLDRVSETIRAIKSISSDLGIGQPQVKSKEEIITGLIGTVADRFAPAINNYVEQMNQMRQQPYSAPMPLTPEQQTRLQQIQAERPIPQAEPQNQEVIMENGEIAFSDLVDVADNRKTIDRKPVQV
jgi:Mg2+ and Co2+ transporter CorA